MKKVFILLLVALSLISCSDKLLENATEVTFRLTSNTNVTGTVKTRLLENGSFERNNDEEVNSTATFNKKYVIQGNSNVSAFMSYKDNSTSFTSYNLTLTIIRDNVPVKEQRFSINTVGKEVIIEDNLLFSKGIK